MLHSFAFFTHQEKGGLFSGLIKKTPKASGDEAAAEVTSYTVNITVCGDCYHTDLYTVNFYFYKFLQDKDDQRELTASNDSLSGNNNTKVVCWYSSACTYKMKLLVLFF